VNFAPLNAVAVAETLPQPVCAHFEPACQLASYHNFQFATHLGHELCLGWLSKDWQVLTFLFPCQPPRRPKLVRLN